MMEFYVPSVQGSYMDLSSKRSTREKAEGLIRAGLLREARGQRSKAVQSYQRLLGLFSEFDVDAYREARLNGGNPSDELNGLARAVFEEVPGSQRALDLAVEVEPDYCWSDVSSLVGLLGDQKSL